MAIRLGLSVVVGAFTTTVLFYIMQTLIATSASALTESAGGRIVEFVRVREEQEVETKKRQKPKPPPPDEPPPDVPETQFDTSVDNTGFSMHDVNVNVDVDVQGGGFGISDGEYLPIVKVQPVYPRRALSRGMEGWVVVEFTVNDVGAVEAPTVIANCAQVANPRAKRDCVDRPSSIFDQAAIKAALKFKYKPKVVNGVPQSTAGVQNKISFELEEG